MPVPLKALDAFTVPKTFKVAVLLPVEVGVKVRMIVQEPLTATEPALTHVPPLRAKSPELAPVTVKNGVLSVSVAVPELETVKVIPALVVFCN